LVERRRHALPVIAERRSWRRRRNADRRESASGHLRNAMQLLLELGEAGPLDAPLRRHLEAVMERLWLALAEGERAARAAGVERRRRNGDRLST
jgi:hypothetical protein